MNSIQASKSIIDTWNSILPGMLFVIFLFLVYSTFGKIGCILAFIILLTYLHFQEPVHKYLSDSKKDSKKILLTPYECAKNFQQSYGKKSKFFLGLSVVTLSALIFQGVEVLFSTTMLLAISFIHLMAVSRKFLTLIYKYLSKTFKKFISFFTRQVCTFTFLNFKKNIPPQVEFPKFRISRPPRTVLA